MKNHFIFSWAGNKRMEVEKILELVNLTDDIKTIIEPFCGTSAFSVYISKLYPKKYKYIINDNDDNLIKLYNYIKNNDIDIQNKINNTMKNIKCKDDYLKIIDKNYNDQFISWFISHKISSIRPGLYDTDYVYSDKKNVVFKNYEIYNFLKNEDVEIINGDGIQIFEKYLNNNKVLLFIDPPYLSSCNHFYSDKATTNVYEYMYNNNFFKKKSNLICVLEENWIIKLLFKKYYFIKYEKLYQVSKKKTTHLVILNKKQLLK